MPEDGRDKERGERLRLAIALRGHKKMLALATDLGVSQAALSKWQQGENTSSYNPCRLVIYVDAPPDCLLLGRKPLELQEPHAFSTEELDLLIKLRQCSPACQNIIYALIAERVGI